MSGPPSNPADESDLLLPFEQQILPPEYKNYYRKKRNNFFASVQKFPALWNYYTQLDRIWVYEVDLLKPSSPNSAFPALLYINAHAKARITIELGFAGCVPEARSILRDAVEFVAHAHHMLKDPRLQEIWLNKDADEEAFKKEFWYYKGQTLFAGLEELYDAWCKLSERGSHANLASICERVREVRGEGQTELRLNYTGGMDEKRWAMSIFDMLLTVFAMENAFFRDYALRFQFDERLLNMRAGFETYKEQLRRFVITRYDIKPPESPLIVL